MPFTAYLVIGFCLMQTVHGLQGAHHDEYPMLPNERTTLDDCNLRYHILLGRIGLVGPALGHRSRLKETVHLGIVGWTQSNGTVQWRCEGTLIWFDVVLTAARCTLDSNGQQPDVVRFGGLNVNDSENPDDIQQFDIVNITRFPEYQVDSPYHDIALLRLEKNVTTNSTAVPACLWTKEEFRFKTLNTTIWVQEQTQLKIAFKELELSNCSTNQTEHTSQHLKQYNICGETEQLDVHETIPSGAPLQIRLTHNGRVSPFLVGISTNENDGSIPRNLMFTKVASYQDWIIATMRSYGIIADEDMLNSTLCAMHFATQREYEDRIITYRSNESVSIDLGYRSIKQDYELPSYIVQLAWHTEESQNCYGVVIDESTVLTLAQCTIHDGSPVAHVLLPNNIWINVSSVHIHPEYGNASARNNIAILKLEKFIDTNQIQPTCIWYNHDIPSNNVDIFGFGRADIHYFWPLSLDSTFTYLQVSAKVQTASTCLIPTNYSTSLDKGSNSDLICLGRNFFLVPDSCQLLTGGALRGSTYRYHNSYPTTYGLVQFGQDCGFGEHALATNLASHVKWMESVLLPKRSEGDTALQFIDSDQTEGDSCTSNSGKLGLCVPVAKCSEKWVQLLSSDSFLLCSSNSVVCCPTDLIIDDESIASDLLNCPEIVTNLAPISQQGSMVRLGWLTNDSLEFRCIGSIITNTVILTTASCLGEVAPNLVELAGNVSQARHEVSKVLLHPAYNSSEDSSNNIALVSLKNPLEWSSEIFPACLWINETHTPLVLRMVYFDESGKTLYSLVLPMYNSDCQRTHPNRLLGTHICAKNRGSKSTCVKTASQLMWHRADKVQFIVGLAVEAPDCKDWYYMIFTRVASFKKWIAQNLQ
ncbi:uncharacterized protein LOC128742979 [Sabethes cyaneus]|uniref:uncharacterized protein LOC128742979 n=1 Tax=Sabethes cyaneus TaxID=53552 RepID=UPI00237E3249|nr:uncharacterized protein LOC128742979 [Sabethes cyaneus]